jgi:hypothetical protein
VAVVQISKIQVRRGQKNVGTGLPQLASGEIGWAIDTRELYIGNGAVSEGAPAVGNTKVLTQYDDLFSLADTYVYNSDDAYTITGADSANAIKRTLQQRLDDRVSVRSFGAKGDGSTDDTAALQRAIDQLYLNSATKGSVESRIKLHIEAGTYVISDTLYIPPQATIIGEGSGKTILRMIVNKPALITVNSTSIPGTPSSDSSSSDINMASNITMQGMTVQTTATGAASANVISSDADPDTAHGLILQSCKDSTFEDIAFLGTWVNGAVNADDNAVTMNNLSGSIATDNNKFINCKFEGYGSAVRSNWDADDNRFTGCKFTTLGQGVVFGETMTLGNIASGQNKGPSANVIENSLFNDIHREAIRVYNGVNNSSKQNKFTECGNNGSTEVLPAFSVIRYEKDSNKSFDDYFSRTYALSNGNDLDTVPYLPEVSGTAFFTMPFENVLDFGQVTNVTLFRLPGVINQAYELDYTLVSENYRVIRSGTLYIVIDAYNETAEISDEFHFNGDETYLDNITFGVDLRDADLDLTKETIDVKVISSMPSDDTTQMKYTVTAKKTNVI